MQRDKKGRFIKKAQTGTQLLADGQEFTWNGRKYRVKAGANQAFTTIQPYYKSMEHWLGTDGLDYVETVDSPITSSVSSSLNDNTSSGSLNKNDTSAGLTISETDKSSNNFSSSFSSSINSTMIDKTKLANFLDYARAGIGASVNNKIAKRALEVEKPFLQDVAEIHRPVYGDYRAKVQGEKAAAQLRNLASRPITSDGALQQQMMMDAQIKGQDYIDQGNAKDDALIRQTNEVAWQQEKENQQQRQAVAMQNRQAMLMTEKNKSQIKNMRDSANYSQIIAPLLAAEEQRIRNKAAEQDYYQNYYDEALVSKDVLANYRDGFTDSQKIIADLWATGGSAAAQDYIAKNPSFTADFNAVSQAFQNEIVRRKAALRNVSIKYNLSTTSTSNNNSSRYGIFDGNSPFLKKGGTIYKARLTKRTRDNDRGAKSIESSKKIAARFLEKAIDSLYTYNDVELIAKPKRKRKYQAGGGLPFVSYTPVFATSEKGSS